MTPLPPTRRSTHARPGPRLALAVAVGAVTGALMVGACAPAPSDPGRRPSASSSVEPARPSHAPSPGASIGTGGTEGLWVLVGSPGAMRLVRSAGEQGLLAPDPATAGLPPDARWVSGDADRGFVATVGATGRILTPAPTRAGAAGHAAGWRPVSIRPAPGSTFRGPPSFAALSPDGRSIAATVGDPTSGAADAGLLVVDRASGRATVAALDGRLDGYPPAWLGDGTVAVPILDRSDTATMAVVDRATGRVVHRPALGGSLAASADGQRIAMSSHAGDRIVVGDSTDLGSSAGWIDAVSPTGLPDPTDRAAQVLLDATGTRLAVAWLDATGEASNVTVYGAVEGGWTLAGAVSLPSGATRVVLVGFDP